MATPVSPKKRLFEHFARVAKAMASPNRLELLEALAQGERSVDALAQANGMSVANTSHHLQDAREAHKPNENTQHHALTDTDGGPIRRVTIAI